MSNKSERSVRRDHVKWHRDRAEHSNSLSAFVARISLSLFYFLIREMYKFWQCRRCHCSLECNMYDCMTAITTYIVHDSYNNNTSYKWMFPVCLVSHLMPVWNVDDEIYCNLKVIRNPLPPTLPLNCICEFAFRRLSSAIYFVTSRNERGECFFRFSNGFGGYADDSVVFKSNFGMWRWRKRDIL